ncbi:MAG: iron-sulfur cluster insertion protein ErpA [Rhodospirillaceae bacterium]|nr:iron-sulfur cluster insertion protein ErpA [Rhodospirillaceae bacterium]
MNNISPELPDLVMTKAAAERVRVLTEGEGNPALMLRLSVSGGGCSGFSYAFSLDADSTADDRVFDYHGSKLVVDETSLDLLKGSQIDYVDDLMAASFRISNPNATSTCGCGTSFAM